MRPSRLTLTLLSLALLLGCLAPTPVSAHDNGCEEAKVALEQDVAKLNKEVKSLKAAASEQKSNLDTVTSSLSAKEAALADCKAKLKEAERVDLPKLFLAIKSSAQLGWSSGMATLSDMGKEVAAGKFDKVTAGLAWGLASIKAGFTSVWHLVQLELEEHTPSGVKAQVSQAVAKASALWQQHVVKAAWAQPLRKQGSKLHAELSAVIAAGLSSHPSLKPFADDVTVQLVVGAVFVLPLVLLLVMPFALSGGKAKKAAAPRPKAASKKGKAKPKA